MINGFDIYYTSKNIGQELKPISTQKLVVSGKGLKPISTSKGRGCKKIGGGLKILK